MLKKQIFKTPSDFIINCYHHTPAKESEKGIILCHGMQSSSCGIKVSHLAKILCDEGYHTFRFDFRYVGDSRVKFEEIKISCEIEDLTTMYNFAKRKGIKDLSIIGSSLGATIALLFTSKADVTKLVLISAPVFLDKSTWPETKSA
mgnify:CR=1 FL=1